MHAPGTSVLVSLCLGSFGSKTRGKVEGAVTAQKTLEWSNTKMRELLRWEEGQRTLF